MCSGQGKSRRKLTEFSGTYLATYKLPSLPPEHELAYTGGPILLATTAVNVSGPASPPHETNGGARTEFPERGKSGFRAVGGAVLRTSSWAPPPVRLPFPSAASFQPCPSVGAASGAAAAAPVPAAALSPPTLPTRFPSSPAMALLTAAARLIGAKVSN